MEVKLPGHKPSLDETMRKAVKACQYINAGMRVADVAKKLGVTKGRVYQWRNLVVQYGHEKLHNNQ